MGIEGDQFSSARRRLEEKTRTLAKKFEDCKGKKAELELEREKLVREVTELKIQSCREKTRFDRQKLMNAAVSLVETLKREAESRLPTERRRSVVDDLLCVKGLFSTILWMFCVRFLPPNAESTLLRLEAETSSQRAFLSEVWRFENECRRVAVGILTFWVKKNKCLACLLTRCVAFQRGVRGFFASAAERLKDKADLKRDTKMIATVDALTRFLRTAMVCREAVEGFNACEGLGGEGKALDFAPWFRALYWYFREMEDQKKGRPVVALWGGGVRKIEAFGMMEGVRKAERDAFASADAAADARYLCESALYDPVYRNNNNNRLMNTRLNLMWRMKAIEMSVRNRRVARRMERGKQRMKALGVLREMEREWETAWQVECDEETAGAEEENEDEQVQRLYLALLILYLEAPSPEKLPSVSLHSLNSKRSYAQHCLLEWFACCSCERKGDKKDSRETIWVGKGNSHSKASSSSSTDCHPSPPLLSDLCVSSLSDFLRDHVLSFSRAGVALDYSYTSTERKQGDHAEASLTCVPSSSSSSLCSFGCSAPSLSSSDSLVASSSSSSLLCFPSTHAASSVHSSSGASSQNFQISSQNPLAEGADLESESEGGGGPCKSGRDRTFKLLPSLREVKKRHPLLCNNTSCEGGAKKGQQQLLHCMECRLSVYCSRECQKADWNRKRMSHGDRRGVKHADPSASLQREQNECGGGGDEKNTKMEDKLSVPCDGLGVPQPSPSTSASPSLCAVEMSLYPYAHRLRCRLLRENVLAVLLSQSHTVEDISAHTSSLPRKEKEGEGSSGGVGGSQRDCAAETKRKEDKNRKGSAAFGRERGALSSIGQKKEGNRRVRRRR
uniref:MYND-type domain-containing protein n=1 Tax=Chromera velia CCMP2878 TaxID=1169474 RepID=A0A0G4IF52_9ALVE|eukprot:Cvel_13943.t1-p1 / transcript=Cvel_13943.t1 / gene=Cvel_13943 / organism=Chromera_velia_CCMP2878 / gene_product=hypothetical protein / transcript_product=hypothetical protein / location=Cvel_scaffold973:43060-45594(+) / protein_length=845 / sequence_SO=supercontig / SO=protein_coding / is_pseudo=false